MSLRGHCTGLLCALCRGLRCDPGWGRYSSGVLEGYRWAWARTGLWVVLGQVKSGKSAGVSSDPLVLCAGCRFEDACGAASRGEAANGAAAPTAWHSVRAVTGSTRLRALLGCGLVVVGGASASQVGASVCQCACNTMQQSTPARNATRESAAECVTLVGCRMQGARLADRIVSLRMQTTGHTHAHMHTHARAPFFCALHTRLCRQLAHARVWFEQVGVSEAQQRSCQARCVSRLLGEGRLHRDTGSKWRESSSAAENLPGVPPCCCSPSSRLNNKHVSACIKAKEQQRLETEGGENGSCSSEPVCKAAGFQRPCGRGGCGVHRQHLLWCRGPRSGAGRALTSSGLISEDVGAVFWTAWLRSRDAGPQGKPWPL